MKPVILVWLSKDESQRKPVLRTFRDGEILTFEEPLNHVFDVCILHVAFFNYGWWVSHTALYQLQREYTPKINTDSTWLYLIQASELDKILDMVKEAYPEMCHRLPELKKPPQGMKWEKLSPKTPRWLLWGPVPRKEER